MTRILSSFESIPDVENNMELPKESNFRKAFGNEAWEVLLERRSHLEFYAFQTLYHEPTNTPAQMRANKAVYRLRAFKELQLHALSTYMQVHRHAYELFMGDTAADRYDPRYRTARLYLESAECFVKTSQVLGTWERAKVFQR
jgi:hypothetical protein